MFATVTEHWINTHTEEESAIIAKKNPELVESGALLPNKETGYDAYFKADGSPVRVFTSKEAAEEYVEFYKSMNPRSLDIDLYETEEALNAFLASIKE